MPHGSKPVLRVQGLTVHYETDPGPIIAVNDIEFEVYRGETLGLVGESGCGKTTTAMALLRLLQPPGRVVAGRIHLNGTDVLALDPAALRAFRWREMSLIPQGAMNALNPVMRIEKQIGDAIAAHTGQDNRKALRGRIAELFDLVGLPRDTGRLYPHELSGGMKQRVCIAMAVALNPPLIIADEPTSALDVVVQRLVAQSLLDIKNTLGNSMILIGHDMGLMAQLADRVAVMYAGIVAETAPVAAIFDRPMHPYTRQLIESVPSIKKRKELRVFSGGPPDLRHLPPGCPFAPRCTKTIPRCHQEKPALSEAAPGQYVACHLYPREVDGRADNKQGADSP
jgi:peptide/nickel transport system ATP-binding protein